MHLTEVCSDFHHLFCSATRAGERVKRFSDASWDVEVIRVPFLAAALTAERRLAGCGPAASLALVCALGPERPAAARRQCERWEWCLMSWVSCSSGHVTPSHSQQAGVVQRSTPPSRCSNLQPAPSSSPKCCFSSHCSDFFQRESLQTSRQRFQVFHQKLIKKLTHTTNLKDEPDWRSCSCEAVKHSHRKLLHLSSSFCFQSFIYTYQDCFCSPASHLCRLETTFSCCSVCLRSFKCKI